MIRRGRPQRPIIFQRKKSTFWWIRYRDRDGKLHKESTGTPDEGIAEQILQERLKARDEGKLPILFASRKLTFGEWLDWYLETRSKPPLRAQKTHEQNLNAAKYLRPVFGELPLSEISAEAIEDYIRKRLHSKRKVHTKLGVQFRDTIKPVTVHQEYRVLRRLLNVAVKKKVLGASPFESVEFPMLLLSATRKPHYMTSDEQRKIEFLAPDYLRRIVTIISEMGLRPQKELFPMLKSQVDISNGVVHIPDSKTSSGVADMPMTLLAKRAFQEQIEATPVSDYLFPSPSLHATKPHISKVARTWRTTLRRAAVPYFPLYHLRHTFATRLSAGGVADNFVTQMLRQGDAQVFKRYSQAKLNMMRESLEKLDRQANEHRENSGTPVVN
jgi:integrase